MTEDESHIKSVLPVPSKRCGMIESSVPYPISHLGALIILILIFTIPYITQAQEIDFSSYENYTITLENISIGDLEFQTPVVSGGGLYQVELIDAYVLSILGVKYLDARVDITGEGELLLDGNPENSGDPQKSIPFTLKAAYANRGQNNISDSQLIPMTGSNIGNVRFPILGRQQQPPGPPPTPPTAGFDQSLVEEAAYLYLYGEIDVGNVDAGFYTGTIIITVEYE